MTSTSTPAQADTQRQGCRDRAATLVAASLGFSVIQLDVFVVNVGISKIGADLGGGTSALQWVVGIYTLLLAALILTAGALGDRFGARRMYATGFTVFTLASLACGLAPGMGVLIAARAVQGAGAALLGACSLALLNHSFPDPGERARAVGLWAAGASVALALGPVLGGILIAAFGWRSIFFINLPIGAVGLFLTLRYAAETPEGGRRIDMAGQVAAIAGLGALAYALIEGGVAGYSSLSVLIAFALAAIAAAAFVLAEAAGREPMLPLRLFRHGAFAAPAFLGLVLNIAFYGLIFLFSLLFQQKDGYSALRAGLAFLPMAIGILVANLLAGRVGGRIGVRPAIWTGLVMMAAGAAGLLWTGPGTPFADLVVQVVLLGSGLGLLVPLMTNALMSSVDRSRSGVAAGTLNAMRQTGSVLGVAVFGSLVAAGSHFSTGLHVALMISLGLVIVGAVLVRPLVPAGQVTTGGEAWVPEGREQCSRG